MKAEDVMTRRVVACRLDTDLSHAARMMWENDCGVIPVVDHEDRVVGIVTDRDVCMSAYFQGRSLRELRATGCMGHDVATCRPSDSVAEVARVMAERKVRRIPVTDELGRLLGIISVGDLLRHATRAGAKKKKQQLQEVAVEALTAICEGSEREIEPALPTGRPEGRSRSKKRASEVQ